MISILFMLMVVLAQLAVSIKFMFLFIWILTMVVCYMKWHSHFSMVLINLEFFTLTLLYVLFNLMSTGQMSMSLMMLVMTGVVMEACLGLALLILVVREQKVESLVSCLE